MTRLFKITAGTAFMLLLGLMMSCNNLSEDELGLENQGKGTVVFKITDAPFPVDLVEEANVTIDWIELHKNPTEGLDEEAIDEEEVILIELEEAETYNLLELRNGLTASMAEIDVPAGAYAEIRLHVVDAGILLKDGTTHNLKVPSGDASGIKIKLEPALDVVEGLQAEVLIDFDLSRSFVMRGNPNNNNGFIFKPVVRAVANVQTAAGEISGTVTYDDGSPIGEASLTLFQEDEQITSAITEVEDGFYSMPGILPGTYIMLLEVGDYSKEVPVTVEARVITELDFVVETADETNTTGGETDGEGTEESTEGN